MIIQDEKGGIITLEALVASIILITVVIFALHMVPNPGVEEKYSDTQLEIYGRDILRTSFSQTIEEDEIKFSLYREYRDDKWGYDENISDDSEIIDYDGKSWTKSNLLIDSNNESLEVSFVIYDKEENDYFYPENGVNALIYPEPGDSKVIQSEDNNLIFDPPEEYDKEYYSAMVWFEGDQNGISNPIIVYIDREPEDHDEIVEINGEISEGEINLQEQIAHVNYGESIIVEVSEDAGGGQLHLVGADDTNITTKDEDKYEKGVEIEVLEEDDRYEITFDSPAGGGYSVHWGPGQSHQWSDPVYINVETPIRYWETYNYLDVLLEGRMEKDYFDTLITDTIPPNLNYNLYVYDTDGEILEGVDGEEIKIENDPYPSDAVEVKKLGIVEYEGEIRLYEARIVLWYK